MPKITVTKLKCERKQDITGKDEPIIDIAGEQVWEGKLGKGDTAYPNVFRSFDHSVVVELKEKDGKKFKPLKSWTIRDDLQSETALTASSSGFHYVLWYEVAA